MCGEAHDKLVYSKLYHSCQRVTALQLCSNVHHVLASYVVCKQASCTTSCDLVEGRQAKCVKACAWGGGSHLWIAKHTDKLLHCQVMRQLLKSLRLVLGQSVVHVKPYSLQECE